MTYAPYIYYLLHTKFPRGQQTIFLKINLRFITYFIPTIFFSIKAYKEVALKFGRSSTDVKGILNFMLYWNFSFLRYANE